MKKIEDLQKLVIAGHEDWSEFGHVKATSNGGDLLIFSYTNAAQYAGKWNWFERVSRGLIINRKTGEIVARPFDKFFNWGEGGRKRIKGVVGAYEKMDGSLGISYAADFQTKISTRGSFDSDQALWATQKLKMHMPFGQHPTDNRYTMLFEIIYPGNRIIVDYGKDEQLCLLAMRDRENGAYLSQKTVNDYAKKYGFPVPRIYDFGVDYLLNEAKTIPASQEGWVILYKDGSRLKIKGDRYKELHKAVAGLSYKNTIEVMKSCQLRALKETIPDEFMGDLLRWEKEIRERRAEILWECALAFDDAPKDTRKEFAIWVMENKKEYSSLLFKMMDGVNIDSTSLAYDMIEKERQALNKGSAER